MKTLKPCPFCTTKIRATAAYMHAALDRERLARSGIYIASKTRHAARWKMFRDGGQPIISTWIDEAGEGQSADLNDLWQRCIREASMAAVLIAYREAGDILKGAWVEIGAALASGVQVLAVGIEHFTIAHDRRITHFNTIEEAFSAADAIIREAR